MFRAQQNAFDDAIAKATDEQLTSENWELILDVCDRVSAEETGAKDAVASMIKRLAHRNANVQLYALELANSLSQNCGIKMHRELASRSFTDAVLRLANDRNTHQQVKAKILELLGEWTEMYSMDPDLGIMEQAYLKLKSQNPNLIKPSKPTKQQITDIDRQHEEKELQLALELSIKEKAAATQSPAKIPGEAVSPAAIGATQRASSPQPIPSGTIAATVSRVRALFDFQPTEAGELQFHKGDVIAVLESAYKDWWKGSLRGETGIFPLNYVEKLSDPTQEQLQREAQMEAEVFGELKNVEKLLTLLGMSSPESNVEDDEEITSLYQSMLAIRPKLVELIRKYSQRKDDFMQLNEKFVKASRDYESFLDSSVPQPARHPYGGREPHPYGYGPGGYPTSAPSSQQPPGRYYPPGPSDSRIAQKHIPPQNGPHPFFVGGQGNQPSQQPPHFPPHDPRSRTPSGGNPLPSSNPYHPRPESTYDNPQELSTSQHATPTADTRPQSYPTLKPAHPHHQPPQDGNYHSSGYSTAEEDLGHPHPPQQLNQGQQGHPVHPVSAGYQAYHAAPPPQQQQQQQH